MESQNELEDADIPLSISLVEAMEQRYKNILEELREGYKKEAQEHSYAVAEAYHYVGLALCDIGDDEGAKIYYDEAIKKFGEIIEKFEGITPVNAQYRIGNLYEELAMLYEKEQTNYYNKAMDAYTNIIDEQKSTEIFGYIGGLIFVKIVQARERVEYLKENLTLNQTCRDALLCVSFCDTLCVFLFRDACNASLHHEGERGVLPLDRESSSVEALVGLL